MLRTYTGAMQLRTARLCLDCDELHEAPRCPVCASDTFVYLTRWVPVDDRRKRPRPAAPKPAVEPSRPLWRLVKRGAVGLAVVTAAGWLLRPRPADRDGKADDRSS